ncbi:hypothetical protein FXN61_33700 [Lentzea sp. PSKA42]|uniref:NHLP leader peptide domain-containing protein n=1 Tax=Lentzea indica TaxID=2604800 RepID=A0ABX1FS22_9PSEU|nr:hypothetical protein [Lentzea indica]NKE61451.1 hypothetical protein [Lentzea indica]
MDPRAKATFISAYTRVLSQAWSSDEFTERLAREPRVVLGENGLDTPADAEVEIIRSRDADPDLEAQITLWGNGFSSGRYVLYVPDMPQIDTRELSEEDLDAVAGGADTCCCCCPCSSCS